MKDTGPYNSDTTRYHAVMRRDQAADGCFYYAVKTTGVFCRPGCSSRRPNRDNVEFFESVEDAEAAGYRACLRCNPTGDSKNKQLEQKITAACRSIEQSNRPQKLNMLAESAGMSPHHFQRLFKKLVGVTPKQYESHQRWLRFRKSLRSSASITEAVYDAGYSSMSGAYTKAGDHFAMKFKEYRAGGAGLVIHYGTAKCILGCLLAAATERGICAVEFGADTRVLVQQLKKRFPKAILQEAEQDFSALLEEIASYIKTPGESFDLPLDIQGTAFQQRVWMALRAIKPGQTRSYTEVAQKIGMPQAARAVATACGSNKLAVIIPCHRVISKSGKTAGYRWGDERKRFLLEHEKERN